MNTAEPLVVSFVNIYGQKFEDVTFTKAVRIEAPNPSQDDTFKVYFSIDGIEQTPQNISYQLYVMIRTYEKNALSAINAEADALQ